MQQINGQDRANEKLLVQDLRAQASPLKSNSFVITHSKALQVILAAEASSLFTPHIREELPAIVSHWLQSPSKPPILLDKSYKERWLDTLHTYLVLETANPASGPLRQGKHKKMVEIDFSTIPFPLVVKPKFTFIDLFAGIGGFRLALQSLGGKCVFSSEWDAYAKQTYWNNFGEVPFGDITQFTAEARTDDEIDAAIPNHDVLAGGFPCQPFSRAGVSARSSLGQKHGFSCEIQGTLFFDLVRIAKAKRPKVLFLENVRNLQSHDGGQTFDRIRKTIENDLGYSFESMAIDSSTLVPQRRKRCYMVCFRDGKKFDFPEFAGPSKNLGSILEDDPDSRFTISDRLWQGHIKRTNRNLNRGVGFTAFEADLTKPANTLVARYYKDGKECLIPQAGKNPRKLTPRECARLQGYDEEFKPHPVDAHAYKQFGNSVAVPVIERIAERIINRIGGLP
jgi:DNA (cytosine-5)-methyltransferase 1